MARYRKLSPRFWTDPKVRDLSRDQKLFFNYCITGIEACTQTNSGIYEIHRSSFERAAEFTLDEVNEIFDFFNRKKSMLLEYDPKEHVIFVKSFLKHNATYKTGITGIMEDFNDTYHKVPHFWVEFSQRYRKELGKIYQKIAEKEASAKFTLAEKEEQIKFLDRLFGLKEEMPALNPIPVSTSELSKSQSYIQK